MPKFKILFLSFLLLQTLHAQDDVAYSFYFSTTTPYKEEAVFLDVNISQLDHSKVMLFNFTLKNSKEYSFHQIGLEEREKYHDLQHEYSYIIYPKKSGRIKIEFDMVKSLTDDDKVTYSISGDRDSVKRLEKEDIKVTLKPMFLDVKSLLKGVDLVGDFKLTHTLDKQKTESFNPINLKVKLKGKGEVEPFELLKENKSYRLFHQAPKVKKFHAKDGTTTDIEWEYAISAKDSFTLPAIELKAFNPKSEKVYFLKIPEYKIEVDKVKEESLLDSENVPPKISKPIDWSWWGWLFSYVLVFIAGFLMPRDLFKRKKLREESNEEILAKKIKSAKSHKELLEILLAENNTKYSKAIEALELVLYRGHKISLSKIIKEL